MKIRDATPGEFAAAGDVMVEAYSEYAVYLPEPAWEEYADDIRGIESRAHESTLLIAEDQGDILGAVTYYPAGTGGGYTDTWPREWAGFRLLAVPPRARGRGLGRALTQAVIDRARAESAGVLALGTTDLMKTARAMYERMGFVAVPEYDFYPVPIVRVYAYTMRLDT